MPVKISIAMASYKGGRFLAGQLDSFALQTRPPDELVVSDDDSPDDTVAIVEAFAARAPFAVRLISNPVRLGYNRNFEQAIAACAGDIIFISDQDDVWFDDKIATMTALLEADPHSLAAVNNQTIASSSGTPTATTVLANFRALGYSDVLFGPGCCTALRRSLLDIAAPFPGDDVPYDHWITIIPALLGARLLCERSLQLYRRHDTNTTASVFAHEKASWRTLVAAPRPANIQLAYQGKIDGNAIIIDRLLERTDALIALGLATRRDAAIAELKAEQDDYSARLACLERGRGVRLPMVLAMLRGGKYDRFQGYKSAIKDLLAPVATRTTPGD